MSRDEALRKRYVQPNGADVAGYLLVDHDGGAAGAAHIDEGLPEPTAVVMDQAKCTAHLFYELTVPVRLHPKGPSARFYDAVQHGLTQRLGGDPCYVGLLAKNPAHPHWFTRSPGCTYTLRELSARLEPEDLRRPWRPETTAGEGRNSSLFDALRLWAYAAIVRFDREDQWFDAVAQAAHALNAFPRPLSDAEVRRTAKSVAPWVWDRREGLRTNRGAMKFDPLPPAMEAQKRMAAVRERQASGAVYAAICKREQARAAIVDAVNDLLRTERCVTVSGVARLAAVSRRTVHAHRDLLLGGGVQIGVSDLEPRVASGLAA